MVSKRVNQQIKCENLLKGPALNTIMYEITISLISVILKLIMGKSLTTILHGVMLISDF